MMKHWVTMATVFGEMKANENEGERMAHLVRKESRALSVTDGHIHMSMFVVWWSKDCITLNARAQCWQSECDWPPHFMVMMAIVTHTHSHQMECERVMEERERECSPSDRWRQWCCVWWLGPRDGGNHLSLSAASELVIWALCPPWSDNLWSFGQMRHSQRVVSKNASPSVFVCVCCWCAEQQIWRL